MTGIPNAETLVLEELFKTYPNGTKAVVNVSLRVSPGEVFGLVGPNGAGKTTLLKLASGLLKPDQGRILCGAMDLSGRPREAANLVGLMPDPLGVYTDLSASEYLEFYARILDLPPHEIKNRIEEVVDLLELEPWLSEEVETLSAGWQRRLALGRLLLCRSPVLLLDEPAAGLDIAARSELLGLVRKLAEQNRTVIISSHILPELQQLADRFGILKEGKWAEVKPGKPFFARDELSEGLGNSEWRLVCDSPQAACDVLAQTDVEILSESADGLVFSAEDKASAAEALRRIVGRNISVYEFRAEKVQLSEFVLEMLREEHEA